MSNLRVLWFALAVVAAPSWASAQEPPQPVYFTRGFQFEDVDISRVAAQLRTFGIPIPVALQGNATVDISVSIPLNQLANGRAYRVQGSLQSPQLQVDTFRLGDLTAALTIANGVLSLTGVEGQFLEPSGTPDAPATADATADSLGRAEAARVLGSFAGEASVELLPLGLFEADLRVQELDARFLDQFLAEPIPALAGAVDGVVHLSAPVQQIGAGIAYTATATLEAEQVAYAGLGLTEVTANLRLHEGTVELTSLAGQLQEMGRASIRGRASSRGSIRGTATVQLIPLGALAIQAEIERFDLALLETLAESPGWRFGGSADVTLKVSAAVANAAEITAWSGNGEFALERLVVRSAAGELEVVESQAVPSQVEPPRVVESARGEFEVAAGTFSFDPIRLDLDGVPLRGSASVRLAETADEERGWAAAVHTESAEVADLLEWLAGTAPAETTGTVSFDIEASGPLDASEVSADDADRAGWRASGTIAGSEVQVAGFRVGDLSHQLQVSAKHLSLEPAANTDRTDLRLQTLRADYRSDDQAITVQNLSLQGWDGQLRGEATWSLIDAGQHRAALDWSDLEFTFRGPGSLAGPTNVADPTPDADSIIFQTTTSGQVQWTAPAAQLGLPAAHVFHLRAKVEDIRTGEFALGVLEVSLDARQLPWQLRGSGELLEIPAEVSAALQIPATTAWDELAMVPGRGSLVAGPFTLQPLLDRLSKDGNDGRDGRGEPGLRGTAAFRVDAVASGAGPPRMTAELAIEELGYGDSRIADTFVAATGLEVLDGRLRLSDLRGELSGTNAETPPLAFSGVAVAELSPLGDLAFDVAADAVDLAWFNPWIPDGMGPFDGTAQGTVRASVPLDEMSRVAAWTGVGHVASPGWQMGELAIRAASAELVLHEAVLAAERINGIANGVALAGRAAVELETDLDPGGAWKLQLQTGNAQAENLFALFGATPPAETSGFVSFDIDASGQAAEPEEVSWQASGEVSADALRLAGFEVGRLRHHLHLTPQQVRIEPLPGADLNRLRLTRLAADYVADDLGWQLRDLRFEGWGGRLSGNALWSRDPEQEHQAEITWSDLRIPIPLELVGVDLADQEDAALHTLTAGSLAWSAPPSALTDPSAHRFTLRTEVRELRAGGVEFGDLQFQIDALDPNWEIRGEGTLLDGPAELTAKMDVAGVETWAELGGSPAEGRLVVGPMQLGNLFQLWQPEEGAEGWSGIASLRWTLSSDGQSLPRSLGQIRIENLSYRNQSLTERLEVEVAGTGGEVELRSVRGTYAGGQIEGSGRWTAGPGPRQLIIRLSSIDASRALLPVVATSGDWFDGRFSADLVVAGRGGPRKAGGLRVNGRMELRNGETFGLQSRSLRARVQGAVSLPSLRWSLQLSDLQVNRGRGRVVGHLRLDQSRARSDRVDLDSQFEATDLDFQEVLAELAGGGPPTFGRGSLTGTATLSGRAIESFADLEGRIAGRLGGTDATAVPGLLSAQNYLGVLSLRNTEFTRGEIEARLRLGELQIREFWLASDQLRLWAEGNVSLRSGRLDIDAVAATGDFQASNPAILALARTLALEATLPISVITRANELLSNRVVNLSLGGTYRRPAVRVRPAATLSQNAARFFLREAAGIVVPSTEY